MFVPTSNPLARRLEKRLLHHRQSVRHRLLLRDLFLVVFVFLFLFLFLFLVVLGSGGGFLVLLGLIIGLGLLLLFLLLHLLLVLPVLGVGVLLHLLALVHLDLALPLARWLVATAVEDELDFLGGEALGVEGVALHALHHAAGAALLFGVVLLR